MINQSEGMHFVISLTKNVVPVTHITAEFVYQSLDLLSILPF